MEEIDRWLDEFVRWLGKIAGRKKRRSLALPQLERESSRWWPRVGLELPT